MPRNTRSPQNHYGVSSRRYAEHDNRMMQNFTPDHEDYYPNSAQYNDRQEYRYESQDRLAHEHHDRPERRRRYQDEQEYRPSNYSDGGHGRRFYGQEPERENHGPNSDNADYVMNKDYSRGAADRYRDSDERHVRSERREYRDTRQPASYSQRTYGPDHDEREVPMDDRYRQSDWAPQDGYNRLNPDRHREAMQNRDYPHLSSNPNRDFDYHPGTEDHETLDREARRRGRHYREF